MRVAVAADHAGFPLKARALAEVVRLGHEVVDLGGGGEPGDDYPDFARAIGEAILGERAERGLLICGSGVGASVAASKLLGIRAAVCHDTYSAHQGVEHDDMNVLCLGARIVGVELAAELIRAFLSASFSGEERHRRRLAKIRAIEQDQLSPREVLHG
ncbi:MAG: ribose 5-phosphate isomerase B [Dehalococcoidia bacterium]|nr:ribose 5-phosphate isomerase B [Dehalococcoidia bacterium]